MQSFIKNSHYYLTAIFLGVGFIFIFVTLDLVKLNLDFSMANIIHIIAQTYIYSFGIFILPILLFFMTHLLLHINGQKQLIKEEFEYLKNILNASPDAIIFLDEKLNITFKNNQFRAMFESFEKVKDVIELNSFAHSTKFYQKEFFLDSNIANFHPFLLSFRLTVHNGKKNFFLSFKDLKLIKDKESIIEEQKNKMIEKNKLASLGEMAAGIAHEINNPLTVISSNNYLIEKLSAMDNVNVEKIHTLTSKNKNQVVRITDIISSLRNLSRGISDTKAESFSFSQLIEEAIELAKVKDLRKRINFINLIPNDVQVIANRGQITQVVINLLSNAIDAIEDQVKPWVKIEYKEKDNYMYFSFTDSGHGISSDILGKIFMPMFTTKDVGQGTGLGLSLSKTYMENNGGSLYYDFDNANTCFVMAMSLSQMNLLRA